MARARRETDEAITNWRGRVEERLDNLIESFAKENQSSAQHRTGLREVMSAQTISIQALTREVAEMKPLVAEYRQRRDEAIGAARVTKVIWVFLMTTAGAIGAAITELVRYLHR